MTGGSNRPPEPAGPDAGDRHPGRTVPATPAIRVLRVFGVLDIGGAELRTVELAPRLIEAGVELHFLTFTGRPGTLAPLVRRLGAQVHPLRLSPTFPLRFIRLLRRLRPQVVHSDVAINSGPFLLLAALAGVPVRIAHFRSDGDGHPDTRLRRARRRLLRSLIRTAATDVIGVAPGALQHAYHPSWRSDPRCRVIPNGVDLTRLRRDPAVDLRTRIGARPDELICLHVGRPVPAKRRWLIPPLAASLRQAGLSVHAVFAGPRDPVEDGRLLSTARKHGVSGQIHLLGPTDDVGGLMRQADVLLLPSAREGLPGVLLEAVAVGTPVVASDLPGTRYAAEHLAGVTLVDPEASVTDWARAVRQAVARPVTASEREAAMRTFAGSTFSLETAARRHLELYGVRTATPSGSTEPRRGGRGPVPRPDTRQPLGRW